MCRHNNFTHVEVDAGYKTLCHHPVNRSGALFGTTTEGYVRVGRYIDGVRVWTGAHRARYIGSGKPLAADETLDHLCRNRRCCNPAHLEVVTNAENIRRGDMAKVTAAQVEELRALVRGGMTQSAAGAKFGLSQSHVSSVVRGRYWSDGPCVAWQERLAQKETRFV